VHINYYQDQTSPHRLLQPPPRVSLLRRLCDFILMVAVGLVVVVLVMGGLASSVHVAGAKFPLLAGEHLWTVTGVGGFLLGLSWRFLFWDLPGMVSYLFRAQRRNLLYLAVLAAGIAVLVLI
jgi:hypothetical protein